MTGSGARRTTLRWRIGLAFSLCTGAAAMSMAVAWIVTSVITNSFDRRYSEIVGTRLDRVESVIAGRGSRVAERVRRTIEAIERADDDRALANRLRGLDAGREWGELVGLDVLVFLDSRGTVLSSMNWPQKLGLPDVDLIELPDRQAVLRRVNGPLGSLLGVLVRESMPTPQQGPVHVVGGARIDRAFLESIANGLPALLLDAVPSGEAQRVTSGAGPDFAEWTRAGTTVGVLVDPLTARSWSAAHRDVVDDRGRKQATLFVAVERRELELLLARVRPIFLGIGIVAILGAAVTAFWVSDRIGRPVGRLVRAVDAIAGGEADYTFPGQPRDELEELAEAFSRMQRRLELQLQRSSASERVAAWREVARHVAHEVKNPLAPIRLTVENLVRARRDAPELFEGLFEEGTRTILEEVEQLRRLVEEFSEFARLPAPRPRPVDLHRLLDEVVELYSGGGHVEIERDYAGVPIVVQADSDQLARAMKNVVANAVEAMDGAGVEHPRIGVRTSVNDGRVTVEIHDNGPGISSDAENKVFEPYFTTRREGTGLGMAIVYRIVTEHGGVIEAGRAPGGGAAITVQLPIGVGAVKDEGSG